MLQPVVKTNECNIDLDCPSKTKYDIGVCIDHKCWNKKINCYQYSLTDTGNTNNIQNSSLSLGEVKFTETVMSIELTNNTTHDLDGQQGSVLVILGDSRFSQNGETVVSDLVNIPIGKTKIITISIDPTKTPYNQNFLGADEVMFTVTYQYPDSSQISLMHSVNSEYFCKPKN